MRSGKKTNYTILVSWLLRLLIAGMQQRSLTVNLGYDIMGIGIVCLSSFSLTQCYHKYDTHSSLPIIPPPADVLLQP
ncbi:hypothetical protein HOY82DRAFT_552774 [Tuber indicum]|nr:hypothetical protein HOY82DRAFT_552774 [Tuber indicum]